MGAVTSLLYGAEDPSIAGMVLDSAFANLYDLMMELVEVYKIRVPKFTVKMAVQYMRCVIQRRAKFDIMDLNVVQFAPKTFIPALFGHASNDMFIQPHHTDHIHQAYAGDKNLIKFEGDHNSPRPQFYYDSVSIFFYNVLHPPQFPSTCTHKLDKYYNLGAFKGAAGTNESLLYEIINGLRAAGTDAGSSSAATASFTNATKSVVELLTERVNQLSVKNDNDLVSQSLPALPLLLEIFNSTRVQDFLLDENHNLTEMDGNTGECHLEDKSNRQTDECCSYTSSNRESWGRCSSLGGASDGLSSGEQPEIPNHKLKSLTLRALATPLRRVQRKPLAIPKEKNRSLWKRLKKERQQMGENISQRLRLCLQGQARHKRTKSS
ncbi:alpha/beta-Hydrolases superfamily protein [Zea mays]|nr:alpha/beta-Hydrolases superfamily protein [Zea mays]